MLKIGDLAPFFEGENQNGDVKKLTDFSGKKVLLYFYPKDDTPGCTKEACAFRDSFGAFEKQDVIVLGVSRDPVAKHKKFSQKYELPFDLIADESGAITESYGVWVEKSMYGRKYMGIERSTFLIDEQGKIAQKWPKVKVSNHVDEVLKALEDLKK